MLKNIPAKLTLVGLLLSSALGFTTESEAQVSPRCAWRHRAPRSHWVLPLPHYNPHMLPYSNNEVWQNGKLIHSDRTIVTPWNTTRVVQNNSSTLEEKTETTLVGVNGFLLSHTKVKSMRFFNNYNDICNQVFLGLRDAGYSPIPVNFDLDGDGHLEGYGLMIDDLVIGKGNGSSMYLIEGDISNGHTGSSYVWRAIPSKRISKSRLDRKIDDIVHQVERKNYLIDKNK